MVLIKWENAYILQAFSARAIKDKILMRCATMPSLEQTLQSVSHTRDSRKINLSKYILQIIAMCERLSI